MRGRIGGGSVKKRPRERCSSQFQPRSIRYIGPHNQETPNRSKSLTKFLYVPPGRFREKVQVLRRSHRVLEGVAVGERFEVLEEAQQVLPDLRGRSKPNDEREDKRGRVMI